MIALTAIVPSTFPKPVLVVLVIGFFGWPAVARVVRGQTLSLVEPQLRRRLHRDGRRALARHPHAAAAEPRRDDHRLRHDLDPVDDRCRGRAVVPGRRRDPADTVVGPQHRRRHRLGADRPDVPRVPRSRTVPHHPRLQRARRRPARRPRPTRRHRDERRHPAVPRDPRARGRRRAARRRGHHLRALHAAADQPRPGDLRQALHARPAARGPGVPRYRQALARAVRGLPGGHLHRPDLRQRRQPSSTARRRASGTRSSCTRASPS